MATTRVLKMEGFKELEHNLRLLTKATGKNVLRRVAKGALEPMADRAAAKAPVETGRLAFSIAVGEGRTGRAKRSTTRFVSGGFRADPSKGIEMAMGPASGFGAALNYASFTEFGTIDTPAFAFMRSAWSIGRVKALRYVKDHLGMEIDKAVKKMLVKRAKAGL